MLALCACLAAPAWGASPAPAKTYQATPEEIQRIADLVDPLVENTSMRPIDLPEDLVEERLAEQLAQSTQIEQVLRTEPGLTRPLLAMIEARSATRQGNAGPLLSLLRFRSDLTQQDLDFVRRIMDESMNRGLLKGSRGVVSAGCVVLGTFPSQQDESRALRALDWRTKANAPVPARRDPAMDLAAARLLRFIGGSDSIAPLRRSADHWEALALNTGNSDDFFHTTALTVRQALVAVQARVDAGSLESSKASPAGPAPENAAPPQPPQPAAVAAGVTASDSLWWIAGLAALFLAGLGLLRKLASNHQRIVAAPHPLSPSAPSSDSHTA